MKERVASAQIDESVSFEDRVFSLLDRTEYRIIRTAEDLEEVGRLRFRSFDAKQIYPGRYKDVMLDAYEHDSHAFTIGVYIDEKLVSSVRLQLITPDHRVSPAFDWFPDILHPLLDQGMSFIDPNRLAVDLDVAQSMPGLPHITLRPAVMATAFFKASACLACVKKEHAAFYRRIFRSTMIGAPIEADNVNVTPVLFSSPRSNIPDTCRRYPFYSFLEQEAELLFGKPKADEPWPLTVLPTARMAVRRNALAA